MKRIGLIVILILVLNPLPVNAKENFHFESRGAFINQRTHYQLKGDTLLNPNFKLASFVKWENKLYGDFSINLTYKEWLKLIVKSRPTWIVNDEEDDKFKTYVDNAYLDIRHKNTVFLTIGKENIQEGVGLSYNPTDFLSEGKDVDYSKREEERKNDKEGNYLLRLESIGDKLTFSFLTAPKIGNLQQEHPRQLLMLYSLVGNADVAFSYFHEKHSKLGLNLSGVVGNNIELHTEIAFSKGRERKFLRKKGEIGPPNSGVYEYEAYAPQDKEKTFVRAIIGGHYTFSDRTNLIIEYFFNHDGYSQSEWDEFIEMVKDASSKFKSPTVGFSEAIFKENLRIANSLMTFRSLRKNYFFVRLSNPGFFNYYDSQLSLLLNLDDRGYVVMPSVDYKDKNLVLRFGINWFCGGSQSEFGLVPQDTEFRMEVKYFF